MKNYNSLYSIIPITIFCFIFYNFLNFFLGSTQIFNLLRNFPKEILKSFNFIIIAYFIRFLRWRFIFYSIGKITPLTKDLLIWLGSFTFAATPARSGELYRCFLLKKKLGIDKSVSFGALLIERITEGTALLLIIFLHFPLLISWTSFINFQLPLKEFSMFALITLSITIYFKKNIFLKIKNLFYNLILKKFPDFEKSYWSVLSILLKPKLLIISTLIGLISCSLEGISFYTLLNALDASINIQQAILSQLTAGLLGAISLTPGGIGTTEASSIGILMIQNININIATSATILGRLISLWMVSFIGFICFLYINKKPNFY